ncbi:MAG: TIM barrel protein [Candidatus Omnitrophota bacterium]
MLAISTAWNSDLHFDIRGMLSQIQETGFDAIEIGCNFIPERLEELIALVNTMKIKVVSMHNFCPLPPEPRPRRYFTDYYRLSSLNEPERSKAVEYTKKTIDTACLVSCRAVVIHAGTVEVRFDQTRELFRLYAEGKCGSKKYLQARNRILASREAAKKRHLQSVARSLEEVLVYANSAGIKIGLETRYYPNEIPNIEETEYFLKLFHNQGLVYWHDVGHAEVNQRFGIASHEEYLQRFSKYMGGIHIHGIKGIDDHLAPFDGDFNLSKITPYLRDDLIRVIETHPPATSQQIKEAIKRLS